MPPITIKERDSIIKNHTTLADVFLSAGYSTAAFVSNPFLTKFWGYDKGFSRFEDSWGETPKFWLARDWIINKLQRFLTNEHIAGFLSRADKYVDSLSFIISGNPIVTAEENSKQVLEWLNGKQGNFFAWVHFMDVHAPYFPPRKYLRLFRKKPMGRVVMSSLWRKSVLHPASLSQKDVTSLTDLYDSCLRYVDDCIGSVLSQCRNELNNTIIIITADHGDEFGEHGKTGHVTLYDGVLRVPLVIAGQGIPCGRSVEQQVSLLDIAPTLVELSGQKIPESFCGGTLSPLIKNTAVPSHPVISAATQQITDNYYLLSYRLPDRKYIRIESTEEADKIISEEIYHLKNDPAEKNNVAGLMDDAVTTFKQEAITAIEQFKQKKRNLLTQLEQNHIKARLKNLRL